MVIHGRLTGEEIVEALKAATEMARQQLVATASALWEPEGDKGEPDDAESR